nr:unnamed protein product [Callosobruchus analis]
MENSSTTVGTEEVCTMKSSIKAVPLLTYCHVFDLHLTTSCEDVLEFLKPGFPEATCSQLISKHLENCLHCWRTMYIIR